MRWGHQLVQGDLEAAGEVGHHRLGGRVRGEADVYDLGAAQEGVSVRNWSPVAALQRAARRCRLIALPCALCSTSCCFCGPWSVLPTWAWAGSDSGLALRSNAEMPG